VTTFDVIVRGGSVVVPDRAGERGEGAVADVGIAEGRIAAIGPELEGTAAEEVDARGLLVLPGVVDAHVHFNEPGRTDWEGWASGTRALAAGGATVGVEMPLNAVPPTVDAAAFDAKRRCAERSAIVDFALWGGLVPGRVDELDELAARGVVGFKAFMSASGVEEFEAADDLTLYEGMRRAAGLGLPVAVHAESETITRGLAARALAAGRTGIRDYLASRPAIAETEAIARAILLAEETGCALHVVHVSTGRGVALVAAARARGVDVSCETCPHYLLLTDEDAERLGAIAKCAPPLRPAAEGEALWRGLADGTLPMVASDHSPAPAALKAGDAFAAWGGISGCQTLLALMIGTREQAADAVGARDQAADAVCARDQAADAVGAWDEAGSAAAGARDDAGNAVAAGARDAAVAVVGTPRLSPASIARVTSTFPAQRLRFAAKGRIAPGADADLALVDPDADAILRADDLLYRHRHSPFVGRRLRARVVRTLVRGRTVFAEGRIVAAGGGRLVTPDKEPTP
jgi:allantoinase